MLGEQRLGVVLVAVGSDVQEGMSLVKDAPQGAALPGGPPARLVHVQRRARAQPIQQVLARVDERVSDPAQDRVDRTAADP